MSSFVSATVSKPFISAAYLVAKASNQPQRRGRPVETPYSWPRSRINWPISSSPSSISVGKGPSPAGRVGADDAEHTTDLLRRQPEPRADAARGRVRRGDERVRAVVNVEERGLRALDE